MEKSDWDRVEKALSGMFGSAELMVDGYIVSFHIFRNKNKIEIATYINGAMRGAWFFTENNHPESKYLREVEQYLFQAKDRKNKLYRKIYGKRIDETIKGLSHAWGSVKTIRQQYESKFKSIKILKINGEGE